MILKCSQAYGDLVDKHDLRQSMSREGNCWDNAYVESFSHSLKVEAIHNEPLTSRETMCRTVFVITIVIAGLVR